MSNAERITEIDAILRRLNPLLIGPSWSRLFAGPARRELLAEREQLTTADPAATYTGDGKHWN